MSSSWDSLMCSTLYSQANKSLSYVAAGSWCSKTWGPNVETGDRNCSTSTIYQAEAVLTNLGNTEYVRATFYLPSMTPQWSMQYYKATLDPSGIYFVSVRKPWSGPYPILRPAVSKNAARGGRQECVAGIRQPNIDIQESSKAHLVTANIQAEDNNAFEEELASSDNEDISSDVGRGNDMSILQVSLERAEIDLDAAFGGSATELDDDNDQAAGQQSHQNFNTEPTAGVSETPLMQIEATNKCATVDKTAEDYKGFQREPPYLQPYILGNIDADAEVVSNEYHDPNYKADKCRICAQAIVRYEWMREAAKQLKAVGHYPLPPLQQANRCSDWFWDPIGQGTRRPCDPRCDYSTMNAPLKQQNREVKVEPAVHHESFLGDLVYHKTSTPPEVSLLVTALATNASSSLRKKAYNAESRQGVIASQATKLLEPFTYTGPPELLEYTGTQLRDAVVGHVIKVYTPCGSWDPKDYTEDEIVPISTLDVDSYICGEDGRGTLQLPHFMTPDCASHGGGCGADVMVNDDGRAHFVTANWASEDGSDVRNRGRKPRPGPSPLSYVLIPECDYEEESLVKNDLENRIPRRAQNSLELDKSFDSFGAQITPYQAKTAVAESTFSLESSTIPEPPNVPEFLNVPKSPSVTDPASSSCLNPLSDAALVGWENVSGKIWSDEMKEAEQMGLSLLETSAYITEWRSNNPVAPRAAYLYEPGDDEDTMDNTKTWTNPNMAGAANPSEAILAQYSLEHRPAREGMFAPDIPTLNSSDVRLEESESVSNAKNSHSEYELSTQPVLEVVQTSPDSSIVRKKSSGDMANKMIEDTTADAGTKLDEGLRTPMSMNYADHVLLPSLLSVSVKEDQEEKEEKAQALSFVLPTTSDMDEDKMDGGTDVISNMAAFTDVAVSLAVSDQGREQMDSAFSSNNSNVDARLCLREELRTFMDTSFTFEDLLSNKPATFLADGLSALGEASILDLPQRAKLMDDDGSSVLVEEFGALLEAAFNFNETELTKPFTILADELTAVEEQFSTHASGISREEADWDVDEGISAVKTEPLNMDVVKNAKEVPLITQSSPLYNIAEEVHSSRYDKCSYISDIPPIPKFKEHLFSNVAIGVGMAIIWLKDWALSSLW